MAHRVEKMVSTLQYVEKEDGQEIMPPGYSTIEINATLEDLKPPNPFPFQQFRHSLQIRTS